MRCLTRGTNRLFTVSVTLWYFKYILYETLSDFYLSPIHKGDFNQSNILRPYLYFYWGWALGPAVKPAFRSNWTFYGLLGCRTLTPEVLCVWAHTCPCYVWNVFSCVMSRVKYLLSLTFSLTMCLQCSGSVWVYIDMWSHSASWYNLVSNNAN